MSDDVASETLDRVRRIETKVTKLGEQQGIDMGGTRAVFENGVIISPSPHISVDACVAAIPANVLRTVPVKVGDNIVAHIARP